jgi:hypothetical protein
MSILGEISKLGRGRLDNFWNSLQTQHIWLQFSSVYSALKRTMKNNHIFNKLKEIYFSSRSLNKAFGIQSCYLNQALKRY